ncbi:MAG: hypothetical protein V9G19_06755 [Tetrasphaera sp.]
MVNTPSRVPRVTVPVAGTLPPRRTRRTLGACVAAAAATTCLAGGGVAATAAPASDAKAPAANPDVLVNVDHDLYLVSPDGSHKPRRLTTSGDVGGASFSPDRSRIVYSKERDRFTNLYVMRSDGTGAVNLTSGSVVAERDPDWSPDGTQIVFWRVSYLASDNFSAIVTMPAHKGAAYRVVAHNERDIRGCDAPFYGSPVWSPTRAEIAVDALCGSEGREVIAIFRPNGTLIKTIPISDSWTSGPTYDPTGDQLATA